MISDIQRDYQKMACVKTPVRFVKLLCIVWHCMVDLCNKNDMYWQKFLDSEKVGLHYTTINTRASFQVIFTTF